MIDIENKRLHFILAVAGSLQAQAVSESVNQYHSGRKLQLLLIVKHHLNSHKGKNGHQESVETMIDVRKFRRKCLKQHKRRAGSSKIATYEAHR